ncbi:MAG: pseudouridine synthase [Planctomycetota bacterium]|nr:pseudouridine synthase [Planctomycetota bacterium]
MEPQIRHLDDKIAVVTKPSGMFVHPSDEDRRRGRTILTWLRDRLDRKVYPVHRLDRACSGLVSLALDSSSARELQEALQSPAASKQYLLLARGETDSEFECVLPLKSATAGIPRVARTRFQKLQSHGGFTLLKAQIFTGRRHQIRRHLAHMGHQIVGDTTYGKGGINRWLRDQYGLPRLFLHSWKLSIPAPATEQTLHLTEPLPADLLVFLRSFFENPLMWTGGHPETTETQAKP